MCLWKCKHACSTAGVCWSQDNLRQWSPLFACLKQSLCCWGYDHAPGQLIHALLGILLSLFLNLPQKHWDVAALSHWFYVGSGIQTDVFTSAWRDIYPLSLRPTVIFINSKLSRSARCGGTGLQYQHSCRSTETGRSQQIPDLSDLHSKVLASQGYIVRSCLKKPKHLKGASP